MADARTVATELGTALGMLGYERIEAAVLDRSHRLDIDAATWSRLSGLVEDGRHLGHARLAFASGAAFAANPLGLDGRVPRDVQWTGGRRSPGDEVVPADLMVDHVVLVSCKYRSRVLHNAAPARLFDELLRSDRRSRRTDWFTEVAEPEHQALYGLVVARLGLAGRVPERVVDLEPVHRKLLKAAVRAEPAAGEEPAVAEAYAELCHAVGLRSARRWSSNLADPSARERMLWRLLRIHGAPYFVVGSERDVPICFRIDTPWDWRRRFTFRSLDLRAVPAGQPMVAWSAAYVDEEAREERVVEGHVEIRWSHGRFGQPPEAKVYLDTTPREVPGYVLLDEALTRPDGGQTALW